jgi:hypothetical protein
MNENFLNIYKYKKVIQLEEHDEIFPYILKLKNKNDYIFINIDSHADMSIRQDECDINIGNFISELIYRNCFNEALWIKNEESFEFMEGNYKFFLGENKDKILKSTLKHPIYFCENSYEDFKSLKNPKKINFYVRSLTDDINVNTNNKKWILSIDYDFFSCNNPYSNNLKEILNLIGKDNFKIFKKQGLKGFKITSKKEFEKFTNELSEIYPNIFNIISGYIYPEFSLSNDEIKKSIIKINDFLFKNFDLNNCLGIFLINSLSSGYTNKNHYMIIDDLVKQNLLKPFLFVNEKMPNKGVYL